MRPLKTAAAILLMAAAAAATGCGSKTAADDAGESTPPTAADLLRARLDSVARSPRVMFGHHDDPVYGHTWAWDKGRSDVLAVTGEYPAVMSWDLGHIELDSAVNLDGVPFDRMRDEVIAQHRRGGISVFSWHLNSPVDPADPRGSWISDDPTIVHTILTDSVTGTRYREWASRVGDFFTSLTDPATGEKIPVVFRPLHEHTGGWFWWGADQSTPDDYKALWQATRRAVDARGADNVLWAYSPDRVATAEKYMERYPGDSIVDIMGADVYHFGGPDGAEAYMEDAARVLDIAIDQAARHGKIAAFTETGLEGLGMPRWWTEQLLPLISGRKLAYVVVWRNAHDKPTHFYAPYPGQESEEDFKAFRQSPATVFVSPADK